MASMNKSKNVLSVPLVTYGYTSTATNEEVIASLHKSFLVAQNLLGYCAVELTKGMFTTT